MKTHYGRLVFLILLGMGVVVTPSMGQTSEPQTQVVRGDSVTMTAEVISFDPDTRKLSLRGPSAG